jgi:hypothetical protein
LKLAKFALAGSSAAAAAANSVLSRVALSGFPVPGLFTEAWLPFFFLQSPTFFPSITRFFAKTTDYLSNQC